MVRKAAVLKVLLVRKGLEARKALLVRKGLEARKALLAARWRWSTRWRWSARPPVEGRPETLLSIRRSATSLHRGSGLKGRWQQQRTGLYGHAVVSGRDL